MTNNILLIIVEYVKQDPDIEHFTVSLETGSVFSRIELWDCLSDENRQCLNRAFFTWRHRRRMVFQNNDTPVMLVYQYNPSVP